MRPVFGMLLLALAGCSAEPDPALEAGRLVWEANCKVCHAVGLAGAPKLGDASAWAPRIAQGEPVLLQHALQGFEGNSGVMPARGGNAALSDDDVTAAVRYMVSESR